MNIKDLILKSLKDPNNKISSSRIFSYIMMLVIFLLGMTHIGIEIVNAVIMWRKNDIYKIPFQNISLIIAWLTHQLVLMGIYKSNESPFKGIIDKKKDDID